MTAAEACSLLAEQTTALSAARAEAYWWRLLALAAIDHASSMQRDVDMMDERSYVNRTRTQDGRDVFIDQVDLRREAA